MARNPFSLFGSLILAILLPAAPAAGSVFHVFIDTSGLGGPAAVMYFDLTNGDESVDHSVTISNFTAPQASLGASDATPVGADISGTLPASVTMTETQLPGNPPNIPPYYPSFITYSQEITLGDSIDFDVEFFGSPSPYDPLLPDGFVFSIFTDTGIPLLSTDENGVLFYFNIGGNPAYVVNAEEGIVDIQAASAVPEPNPLGLAVAAVIAFIFVRRGRYATRR